MDLRPDVRRLRRYGTVGQGVHIGRGTRITAGEVRIGDRVWIGDGVTITTTRLEISDDCCISDGCRLVAPTLVMGENCVLFAGVVAHAVAEFRLGDYAKISRHAAIKAVRVGIGSEFWMNQGAEIGGGGWRAGSGAFLTGDRCHVGRNTHINTADVVELGDDTAVGMDCTIATHAHWQPVTEGFPFSKGPVRLGANVAVYTRSIISPGVTVAPGGTIAGGSVVIRDVPERGLVAGAPARLVRIQQPPDDPEPLVRKLATAFATAHGAVAVDPEDGDIARWRLPSGTGGLALHEGCQFTIDDGANVATFDILRRTAGGRSGELSERVRGHFFSYGVRFRYVDGYRRAPLRASALLDAGLED